MNNNYPPNFYQKHQKWIDRGLYFGFWKDIIIFAVIISVVLFWAIFNPAAPLQYVTEGYDEGKRVGKEDSKKDSEAYWVRVKTKSEEYYNATAEQDWEKYKFETESLAEENRRNRENYINDSLIERKQNQEDFFKHYKKQTANKDFGFTDDYARFGWRSCETKKEEERTFLIAKMNDRWRNYQNDHQWEIKRFKAVGEKAYMLLPDRPCKLYLTKKEYIDNNCKAQITEVAKVEKEILKEREQKATQHFLSTRDQKWKDYQAETEKKKERSIWVARGEFPLAWRIKNKEEFFNNFKHSDQYTAQVKKIEDEEWEPIREKTAKMFKGPRPFDVYKEKIKKLKQEVVQEEEEYLAKFPMEERVAVLSKIVNGEIDLPKRADLKIRQMVTMELKRGEYSLDEYSYNRNYILSKVNRWDYTSRDDYWQELKKKGFELGFRMGYGG